MRAFIIKLLGVAVWACAGSAVVAAQTQGNGSNQSLTGPGKGSLAGRSSSSGSLSRELSQTGGIIHPPPSGDRNVVTPPNQASSRTPVIHPPGTPGGNPRIEPK